MTNPAPVYYKVLDASGRPHHGGRGTWPLPTHRPGKWLTVAGKIAPCRNGLHFCTLEQLPAWLGPTIWLIEPRGTITDGGDKLVGAEARLLSRLHTWNETTARLFAADCAEHVLPLFEAVLPDDDRPRKSIQAARTYARGESTDATWAAARAAAGAAAWAAAWDAAGAAARAATWDAAWAAAGDAAWAATGDAAWDAAWAAARAAARAAAWAAAGAAAWAATGAAAWAAARDAAQLRERTWQATVLAEYLDGRRS